jgi:signal transduction histidine kinase
MKPFIDQEISLLSKEGRRVWLSVNGLPITDHTGKITGYRGIAADVTEKKKMVDQLVSARKKAEENDRLKSAFLHNISHELRTPMNAIMGFSDLMKEARGDEKNYFAEIVQKSSKHLLSLIEDVVSLSRLQSEKIPVNNIPFFPAELIPEVIRTVDFQPSGGDTEIIKVIPEPAGGMTLFSDSDKIGQILSILLSNAIKYTPKGTIQIGFTSSVNETGFFVADTGLGIPVHEQQKIFQSFYRGEEVLKRAIGGTGLGLSIARELVSLLDGTIGFTSTPGKGSRFWFNIPVAMQPATRPADSSSAPEIRKPAGEAHILIAEDERDNFLYLQTRLKNIVKQTDHAVNGREALKLAATRPYDLILMDLKMPEMNGFEATKELKRILPGVPVIAQTAYAHPEEIQAALDAGCDNCLKKPISNNALMEVLYKYFR